MSDTRNDPEFQEMLAYRQKSLSASIKITTWLIALVAIVLLGMFFFLA